MKNNTCAIIAESPMCFAWGFDEDDESCAALKLLTLSMVSHLHPKGITQFVVPIDAGFGLYAAEAVNDLRSENTGLSLTCLVPYEEQALKWSPDLRERYYDILSKCTESTPISIERTPTCEIDAMLTAIDCAGIVIAICSAEQFQDKTFAAAFRYAEKTGREVTIIRPPKLY